MMSLRSSIRSPSQHGVSRRRSLHELNVLPVSRKATEVAREPITQPALGAVAQLEVADLAVVPPGDRQWQLAVLLELGDDAAVADGAAGAGLVGVVGIVASDAPGVPLDDAAAAAHLQRQLAVALGGAAAHHRQRHARVVA